MADHLDVLGTVDLEGHTIGPPNMDPRVDITDIFAFTKGRGDDEGDDDGEGRSILMMNVNPLALSAAFNPDAIYEILIDTNADAVPDISFKTQFSGVGSDGSQTATVVRATGSDANRRNMSGNVIIQNAPVSFGSEAMVTTHAGFKYFAGKRSDPFFFDLIGFFASPIHFTGSDFFADKNVFGTALELPNSGLGSNPNIGVWGRVLLPVGDEAPPFDGSVSDGMVQIDRMGRPAINTVFNKGSDKALFNSIEPSLDRTAALATMPSMTFLQSFEGTLESFGYDVTGATNIADILLPDILTFNYNSSAGFLNGRRLTDDVIDIELNLVTKGTITTDGVGPHSDLLKKFPYLGNPHG